jgi:hypothetical protein
MDPEKAGLLGRFNAIPRELAAATVAVQAAMEKE